MATLHQSSEQTKLQRIDVRTTAKVKHTLSDAAELTGLSMSAFLLEAALEKALALLKQNETLLLSEAERNNFLAMIEKPPKAAKKLKQAMKKYLSRRK